MKKLFSILLVVLSLTLLTVAIHAADVYVNDGGTGDGSSASSPLGDMTEAIKKVANGGTVHIVETYTCADQYVEPAHKGDIVIEGGKYIFDNGKWNRWILSGKGSTTFQNITFEYAQGSTSLIVSQYYDLILGTGLSFPADGKCYVIGGYQAETDLTFQDQERITNFSYDHDSHITVKSGNLWCVAGFNRGGGTETFTGTSYITVEGGEIATVYGANINGNYAGNAVINIKGGTVDELKAAGDATRRLNGNANITVTGGTVSNVDVSNVLGTCTVNYKGGTISMGSRTYNTYGDEPDTSNMKTILNIPASKKDAREVKLLRLSFDTVNVDGESAPETAAVVHDPKVTVAPVASVAPVVSAAPVETTAPAAETTGEIAATSAPAETTGEVAETGAGTEAPETTADVPASAAKTTEPAATEPSAEENSGNVGLIIGIVAAIVVIAAVVAVVLVKKKKK